MPFLLALLMSVTLSPPFGEASAKLIGFTPTEVTFEVSVAAIEPAAIVLMRGEDIAGNEIEPVALLQREDGSWGAVVTLPARSDLRIVFEHIPERGGSVLSAGSRLSELGIDAELLSIVDSPEPSESNTPPPGLAWVIVAAAAALAALALLAVWTKSASGASDTGSKADDEPAPAEV